MNLKLALTLSALLAAPLSSSAGLTMTFNVGTTSYTIEDGGFEDNDGLVNGQITANTAIILDDGVIRYSFASYFAAVAYQPLGGLNGAKYSIQSSVPSIQNLALSGAQNATTWAAAANDNVGHNAQVSVFVNYSGFTSTTGNPIRAQSNTTLQMTLLSVNNANNTSSVDYGAYYDSTNSEDSKTNGIEVFDGTKSLFGHPSSADTAASFEGYYQTGDTFSTTSFSMGVFYGVVPTSTDGSTRNTFNFSGTSYLEMVPEPSHTALPVGIAIGFVALGRRRVTR